MVARREIAESWIGSQPSFAEASLQPPPQPLSGRDLLAVIIFHGMGQQVRFQTLEQAAGVVHRAMKSQKPVMLRRVVLGTQEVTRAEIEYSVEQGTTRAVHVYEHYWAPLTEGAVGLADVFAFLRKGAWAGILSSLGGRFDRWMFGRWHQFRIRWSTAVAFLAAFLVLLSLALTNFVLATVVTVGAVSGSRSDWPSAALFSDLTVDLALFLTALALASVLPIVSGLRRGRGGKVSGIVSAASWFIIGVAISATIVLGVFVACQLWIHRGSKAEVTWDPHWFQWLHLDLFSSFDALHLVKFAIVWGGALIASYWVRKFLVQYVGDVAAYVSAHTVSKFDDLRERIKTSARDLCRAVFEEPGATPGDYAYGKVVVLGHSLGSLIAYDALNGLIRQDLLERKGLRVVERTPLFLTFGSPLDKTAFIFRSQAWGRLDVREAAAATMQPMIESYEYRPKSWINLYTDNDWICGRLDYYDDPKDPSFPGRRVRNEIDLEATTPLAAHGEYWSGSLFARHLAEALR